MPTPPGASFVVPLTNTATFRVASDTVTLGGQPAARTGDFDIGALDIIAEDKIRFRHICFMPLGTAAELNEQGKKQLANDATIRQDVELCTRVQRGHASGMAPTNRVFPQPEFLLSHFQHLIIDMVFEQDDAKAAAE